MLACQYLRWSVPQFVCARWPFCSAGQAFDRHTADWLSFPGIPFVHVAYVLQSYITIESLCSAQLLLPNNTQDKFSLLRQSIGRLATWPAMELLHRARDACVQLTKDLDRSTAWAAVIGFAAIVFVFNYLSSGSGDASMSNDGPRKPREHPSFLPYVGHAPQFAICQEWFLQRLRGFYPEGIFSLRLFGSTHSFVTNPSMATAVMNKPRDVADNDVVSDRLLRTNFGLAKGDAEAYIAIFDEVMAILMDLLTEKGLSDLLDPTVALIKRNIVDLVTFNSSPADQMDWEVAAGAEVVENRRGESFVQVNLLELTRNFVAKTANPALLGTNFVENFPDAWQHLWRFDAGFLNMALVPSWLPLPSVGLARAAGRKFRQYLYEYHEALDKHMAGEDPGAKWQDLDDMSEQQKERAKLFRRVNLPLEARAGADLALVWAMNANANHLIAWMIWEIARDAVLVEQIREEMAPYVRISQPENDFGSAVWIAPEVEHIDIDGLLTKCPLLKGAYVETLRLYAGPWSMKHVKQDMVIGERGKSQSYVLRQGSYVHAPQYLHQLDPEYFPDPSEFHPERHIRETKDEKGNLVRTANMGTMKPYGE